MEIPQYITRDEVRRVCLALKIRDWSALETIDVTLEEARAILATVGGEAASIPLADFRDGLEVELEHGTRFPDANVTNNHPVLTGRIVLAHLKESLLYYKRIAVAELEGDALKATLAADGEALRTVYGRLVDAKAALAAAESREASKIRDAVAQ